ncbi:MAG TPA: DNA methyltransferase [bacterium]|nr:DNA methyltransferase [bacterium]
MAKKSDDKQLTLTKKQPAPEMPEGYYSGDKPNPNLRAFVEAHVKEHPYDQAKDKYDVPAFNEPITTTKATAIYNMHTYWSKKPHDAIRQYIRHYTKLADLILDPFCGSGGTALAALMEGRKVVAIDRSPAATFITKNYCTPVEVEELQTAYEKLKAKVQPDMDWLYETRCDRCGGKATTAYTVLSQVFQCPRCLEKVPLYDCVEAQGKTAKGKPKKINVCPHCHKRGLVEEIKTSGPKFGFIPVLVSYICEEGCKPVRDQRHHRDGDKQKSEFFKKYDLAKLDEIELKQIPFWYPSNKMMNVEDDSIPWGAEWREGRNFRSVEELYTKRNLWALASILNHIKELDDFHDPLLFTFSSILLKASRMMAHNSDGIGRIQKGTYYIPQLLHDVHVGRFMEEALGDMSLGYQQMGYFSLGLTISSSDARNLDIPNDSVDFVFTDPAYSHTVQYGELNFIWEAWLGFDTHWHEDEIVVNSVRGITRAQWADMMRKAMGECYRVLKPGRWLSLCYHDTSEGTWALVQDIMAEVGFVVDKTDSALFIDTKTKTTNQYFADKVTKRDLVINFRKPKPQEQTFFTFDGREDHATFRTKALTVIRNFLQANPGETKDRIYDDLVSRMVSRKQMEAFNFDALLGEIAEAVVTPVKKNLFEQADADLFGSHEIRQWFLKGTADQVDELESKLEDKAAAKLETFMVEHLKAHSEAEGVHFSDIFEQVICMSEKPRRGLDVWLWDYFYKTEDGTWRPPADDEEREEKRLQRATGSLRRIKSYAKALETGAPIPERLQPDSDRTIADWIRQARRAGLYAQGKLLFEKSGLNLSRLEEQDENLAMDVNEDYQYCLKQLGRG